MLRIICIDKLSIRNISDIFLICLHQMIRNKNPSCNIEYTLIKPIAAFSAFTLNCSRNAMLREASSIIITFRKCIKTTSMTYIISKMSYWYLWAPIWIWFDIFVQNNSLSSFWSIKRQILKPIFFQNCYKNSVFPQLWPKGPRSNYTISGGYIPGLYWSK